MLDTQLKDPEKQQHSLDHTYEVEEGEVVTLPDLSSGGPIYRWLMDWKPVEIIDNDKHLTPAQRAIAATTQVPLKRRLNSRHLQMIGLGGSIGAGLFISSGAALQFAGPGGLLIGYFLVGILIFATMQTLGELATRYPVSGAFSAYNSRFLDRSWGFAIGWAYAIGWLITMPSEIIAAAMTLRFWDSDNNGATNVNKAAWVALFLGLIVFINLFGVRGYGEAEFIFAAIKVIAVIGFIIVGIILACGGGPNHVYIGGTYWHHPGAFASGVKGVCKSFVVAAYAFSGTEFAGLAASETVNPRRAIPKACKQVFFRILLFYLVSVIVIGCIVPYTDPRLGTAANASASPFVIAINNAHIKALPSIMNVVIIIAVFSVGNASVFGSTRTLVALGSQGHAPRCFMWVDSQGRPVVGLALALTFGCLAFVCAWDGYAVVFTWLNSIGGMSGIWTWGSVCVCCIRNRLAMKRNGLGSEDLDFAVPAGFTVAAVGAILAAAVLCLQFWTALFPIGWSKLPPSEKDGGSQAESFFEVWLSSAFILVLFVGHKVFTRDWWYVRLEEIDVYTGVRVSDPEQLREDIAAEKARLASRSWLYRLWQFWC